MDWILPRLARRLPSRPATKQEAARLALTLCLVGFLLFHRGPSPERPRGPDTDLSTIPVYILNLPDKKHKFEIVRKRFVDAGFQDVSHFKAADGVRENLRPRGHLKPGVLGYTSLHNHTRTFCCRCPQ